MPRPAKECEIDGCSRKHYGHGMCAMHYMRKRRGVPLDGPAPRVGQREKKSFVEYRAAHLRVEKSRGKARIYNCVDCGDVAQEWSLSPDADEVHMSVRDKPGALYSLNELDYDPRCMSCHRKADGIELGEHRYVPGRASA